ncbi:MAG: adhesin transport system outer membrane protein [Candidatus Paceibacteria bacterium]|jgi:adhesin transport system outer membrane protein
MKKTAPSQTSNRTFRTSRCSAQWRAALFLLHVFGGLGLLSARTEAAEIAPVRFAIPTLRLTSTLICCENHTTEPAAAQKNAVLLTLDQLVEQAIIQHPSVNAKRADLEAANADKELAHQAFYPTPAVLKQQGRSTNGTLISLQQPLWSGGRLSAGLNAASAHTMSADVAITEAQVALALRVASAYQAWLQAHRRIAAFSASIEQLVGYGDRIDRRIQGGASAEVDRILVNVRLLQAESDLSAAKASKRAAIAQLSQVIGYTLSNENLGTPTNDLNEPALPKLSKLLADAIEHNPSLRRIDFDIATANYEAEQKRAARWPTISLRAEHQRNSPVAGSSNNDNRLFFVLEYTPGAGLSAVAQVDAQVAKTQSLRESAEAARRDLVERITIEYEDYLSGQSRQQSLQGVLAASRDVLASYDRLFVAGKRGWLDVVNAARELTLIEVANADLSAQQVGTRYRLRLLAGQPFWLSHAATPAQVDTSFQHLPDATNRRI